MIEMESVLATVSGYHGTERFNLIKLIASTGASYVGSMHPKVTHLVCWKFEGKKYEIAKDSAIIVVNHRWIEECVKKKCRVSELPYTFESGKEVGPLCLDVQIAINHTVGHLKEKKKIKQPVIDLECDDVEDATWVDSDLFNEAFELKKKTHASNRSQKKSKKRNSSNDHPTSTRYGDTLPETAIHELNEPGTSQPKHLRRLRKRNYISPETHQDGHAPVKKHISKDSASPLNMEQGHLEADTLHQNTRSGILPNISNVERHQNTSTRDTLDENCLSEQNDETVNDIEEINDICCDFPDTLHGAPSPPDIQNSKDHHEDSTEDLINLDNSSRPSKSSELSCVICWTEFSSNRGVLPCGHRFCFSCIQNWADQMASRRMSSTCPLCKSSFICITKLDDAHSSDQKIYSQTIPHDSSKMDLYILPDETCAAPANPLTQVCYRCSSREPEDLLIRCHFCNIRCVHRYCLDPPLFPWTCVHCQDLRMLYYNR